MKFFSLFLNRFFICVFTICLVVPTGKIVASPGTTGNPDIHMMFCYTANVLNLKFGGVLAALEAEIDLSVVEINTVYNNSGLDARVFRVHTMAVTYTEIGDLDDALVAITPVGSAGRTKLQTKYTLGNPAVEIPENIDATADTYGADSVVLVHGQTFADTGFILGVSNIKLPTDAPDDPQMCRMVILSDELAGTTAYTMAHEFGHSCGCSHDRWANGGVSFGYFSYSTGYIAPPTTPLYQEVDAGFGTVMSYADVTTVPGTIYPYFSDPDVTQNGYAMGSADNDNVRTLESTLPLVEAHRAAIWTLDPATITFPSTVGGTSGTFAIAFTTTSVLPIDGKINIGFPSSFTLDYLGPTTISGIVGIDGTVTVSVSGSTVTITRNGDGTAIAGSTAISFNLSNIANPSMSQSGYSGNICFTTTSTANVEIDRNYSVLGQTLSIGSLPVPFFSRPPRFKDKLNAFDTIGCLIPSQGSFPKLFMLIFLAGIAILGLGHSGKTNSTN